MTQLTIGSWYRKSSTPHGIALYVELSRICCQVGDSMSSWKTNEHIYKRPAYPGTRSFIYADDLCVTAQLTQMRLTLRHSIYGTKRQNIVKSQMEQYITSEYGPAEVLRWHDQVSPWTANWSTNSICTIQRWRWPHATILCGNWQTRSGAQGHAWSEPQRLLYVISSLNMQHQTGRDPITLMYWIQNSTPNADQ